MSAAFRDGWAIVGQSDAERKGPAGPGSSYAGLYWHLDALPFLARLYWYTVEFELIQTPAGLRIYGSGIVSSKSESIHALESASPNRLGFDLRRVMRTRYRIDTFQQTYFVINGFEQLFAATQADFTPHYAALKGQDGVSAGAVLTDDIVIQRGNREGWSESEDA